MGIYYSAKIMVGLPRCEIENTDLFDEEELEVCPPHYDGTGVDDAIAGICYVSSGDFEPKEFVWDQQKVDFLKDEFKKLTGQDGNVYISPCGW